MSVGPTVPIPSPDGQTGDVPKVAFAREYLRANMPAIYREDPDGFGMSFLGALERVLDPQVAILDCLDAYVSPRLAPPAMVEAMAAWLGLPHVDAHASKRLLRAARILAQLRGTRAGLQIALACCFPSLKFRVEDRGAVLTTSGNAPPPAFPGFTVRCEQALSVTDRAAIEQAIEWQCPLQVSYELTDGTLTEGVER